MFERYSFLAGEGEAGALVEAVNVSSNFVAITAEGKETAMLADVSQAVFEGGEDPAVTVDSSFRCICTGRTIYIQYHMC